MDLRQLRYFVGIVEEKSISLASQRLHVAQPALSQHVRALEAELGVALLLRGSQGVRPTEGGERLYGYALNILKYVDEAVDQVRRYGSEPCGPVAIGLPTSVALVLAVPLIEAVRQELPDVRLRLSEGMSGHILEWLQIHRLDLAMLFEFARASSLSAEPLLAEDLCAICPPGTRSDEIPFVDAARLPLILPGRPHGLRETIERAARGLGVPLNVTAEIDALPQIKMLVQRGVGSSILSGSAVRQEWRSRAIEVRRIVEPGLERTVTLCHLKGRPLSGAAEAVRGVLLRVVRDLVSRDIWPSRPQRGLMLEQHHSDQAVAP